VGGAPGVGLADTSFGMLWGEPFESAAAMDEEADEEEEVIENTAGIALVIAYEFE